MKIVGLTGGIGSGKSTVGELFAALGIPVFNADVEAKRLYSDPVVFEKVIQILGTNEITHEDGSINTKKIAAIVFNDLDKRMALNQCLHPLVREQFSRWKSNQSSIYCIREAAILIEAGAHLDCDSVIVVVCDKLKRMERVMARDGSTQQEVEGRMNAQMSDEERIKYAQFIIDNNGTIDKLKEQVLNIHDQLTR